MARALFKDWFVDFGPTRAKAEGRAPYLAPHLWELFPDALDDEDKPMGWKVQTLSDISSLNPDTWSAKKHPSHVNYVDLSNVKWGTIEATQRYVWADAPSRARRVLYPADTIVGTVRPGNGSYALIGEDGLTGSTGFAVLRPNSSSLRELVYCVATAPENIERLSHLADGAAYPAVRPDVVSATEFVRGNDDISSAFSELTAPLIDRLEANKQESRTLAQTRDLLLPKLISGEIRLREAERMIAEADAETHFRARAQRGQGATERGLKLLRQAAGEQEP
jgi:type I restriction enzyme, S subunit